MQLTPLIFYLFIFFKSTKFHPGNNILNEVQAFGQRSKLFPTRIVHSHVLHLLSYQLCRFSVLCGHIISRVRFLHEVVALWVSHWPSVLWPAGLGSPSPVPLDLQPSTPAAQLPASLCSPSLCFPPLHTHTFSRTCFQRHRDIHLNIPSQGPLKSEWIRLQIISLGRYIMWLQPYIPVCLLMFEMNKPALYLKRSELEFWMLYVEEVLMGFIWI